MKKQVFRAFLFVLLAAMMSCASAELKDADLTTKGLIKARIISRESSALTKWVSHTLYFRKLEDSNDLTKGKIISSSVYQGDRLVLNYEPGIYVIIASMRRGFDSPQYLICYNEELIKKTKVDLKEGDTIDLGEIYIEENSANLLGDISDIQIKTRDTIGSELPATDAKYKLGALDKGMYPKEKKVIKSEEKKEVIEKFE